MKYIVAIVVGALVIGLLLIFAVYGLFGSGTGYFFVKFVAGPVGLVSAFVLFIIYDHCWPKRGGKD